MPKSEVSDAHFPHAGPCEEYSIRNDWELCLPAMLGQTDSLKARIAELEAALRDFAEHGLRADLNPTIRLHHQAEDLLAYLKRLDISVRERAQDALATGPSPEQPVVK